MSDPKIMVIENFLTTNGVTDRVKIDEVVSGFDLDNHVYLQRLEAGDRLFQFIRNPNSGFNMVSLGNWFCLSGASMDSLAIFSGGAGRHLAEFKVKFPISVLEGVSKEIQRNWGWSGGGSGGGTQLFIPQNLFYTLEALGTHL